MVHRSHPTGKAERLRLSSLLKKNYTCFSGIKENSFSPCLQFNVFCCISWFSYLMWIWFTWQTPPFFLSNLVHIMWTVLKCSCHMFLHSKLNCVFSVVSFSTLDAGSLCPVLPQPATEQLMLAGIFPFLLGSPMVLTYLFSVALFFNWKREHE